ncbi:SDR family oxidoreductase [Gangjinia marincola]|uniref:SDR family oxidoreductase n=1 Tax=Gangjinia marincola TaxID=578463 RepID=A0ABN1MHK8_9FLAO
MEFEDKVAYITGGTKGIGLGIAEALLAKGMRVALSGRNETDAQEVATSLDKSSERTLGIGSDVTRLDHEEKAIARIMKKWGQVDVVIANAGLGHFAPVDEIKPDQFKQMIDTNLIGAFHTLKASVEALKSSGGYYMTIASLAGTNFFAGGTGYNASKFGVVGFTQAAMLDLRSHGIKVTTIMPGSVSSQFNGNDPNESDAWKIQPEDIGELVIDLLKMNPRTLPSKIEVRPTRPDLK